MGSLSRRTIGGFWLALMMAAGPALAQQPPKPPPSKEAAAKATNLAERGRRYYDLRRYDQAIREFEAAYQLDNDPAHLYNIAQSHRMASHIPQAIEFYQSYLERLPTAPNRADVERRIAELKESGRPPNTLEPPPHAPGAAAPAPGATTAPAAPPPAGTGYPGWPPQDQAGYPPQGYPPAAGYPPATPLVGDPGAAPAYQQPYYYPPAPAQPAPELVATGLPGDHKHDGFFLRAQLGFGFFNMRVDEWDTRFRGSAGVLAIALGAAFSERFVIYGELGVGVTTDPEVKQDNVTGTLEGDVSVGGFGVGLAYYMMPLNAYLSATIMASQVTVERADMRFDSDYGPGLTLSLGKEWWLGRNFGLGAALQLHTSTAKSGDGPLSATLNPLWGAFAVSATFN